MGLNAPHEADTLPAKSPVHVKTTVTNSFCSIIIKRKVAGEWCKRDAVASIAAGPEKEWGGEYIDENPTNGSVCRAGSENVRRESPDDPTKIV